MFAKIKNKITNYQIVAIMFLLIIFIGAGLLCLPIATKSGEPTPFIDAFFTATSATCVTGLVTVDTFLHWSIFGQIIILILIQIGGLGFMTIMTLFAMFLRRELTLSQRSLFIHSTGSSIGSTKEIIKFIGIGTFLFEFLGACFLSISFIPKMGAGEGIYAAVFHSISAFCNAGFDLCGKYGEFSSLAEFAGDPIVNITISLLIVIGGIGFFVWSDVVKCKFNFKKMSLHTKIVLVTTTCLILGGMLMFYLVEMNNTLLEKKPGEAFLITMLQAIAPRTAGFSSVNSADLSESGRLLTVLLMFIGGSPGSTAGGIKTTTIVVLIFSIISNVRRKNGITVGKRRIDNSNVSQAYAIVTAYLLACIIGSFIICATQDFLLEDVIFEVVSAIGTVGLTTGITPQLAVWSKLIIIFLMYGGRVGMLSLMMIFAKKNKVVPLERPTEKIIIG